MPTLDLSSLAPSTSAFAPYGGADIRAPVPTRSYTTDDPWSVPKYSNPPQADARDSAALTNGTTSTIAGTGLPKEWWRRQETVTVNILGQQGFLLNRYLVYEISTDVSNSRCMRSVPYIDPLDYSALLPYPDDTLNS